MVKINGKNVAIQDISISQYLMDNKYRLDVIVVEYNEKIIDKSEYEKCILKDGDEVEIVSFMGGGC
jgi:thiamine biosynthesis protein ThiS